MPVRRVHRAGRPPAAAEPTGTPAGFASRTPIGVASGIPTGFVSRTPTGLASGTRSGAESGITSRITSRITSGFLSGFAPGFASGAMPRIVAHGCHGALIPAHIRRVARHGPESVPRSGTLCGMREIRGARHGGAVLGSAPEPAARTGPRRAKQPLSVTCSSPRKVRRTVCRTGTPSRWNMPEALVEVTERQPSCPPRNSRSVISVPAVVLAMLEMATIVALMRREPSCPPVRMV